MTFAYDFYLSDFTWNRILKLFSCNFQDKYLSNYAECPKRLVLYYVLSSFTILKSLYLTA